MPYHRTCFDSEFDWVFEGIEDKIIGDFGFSGHGAAGFELDRRDEKLDQGMKITTLAQSFDEKNQFVLVPEEVLTHLTNLSGGPEADVKARRYGVFQNCQRWTGLPPDQSPSAVHCPGMTTITISLHF